MVAGVAIVVAVAAFAGVVVVVLMAVVVCFAGMAIVGVARLGAAVAARAA